MRVISGKAKGRKLKKVPGCGTRPIMDRVKENLFNILGEFVIGSRWLDLFAGTGQVGIEALSRGAAEVIFVDNNRAAIQTTQENLRLARLTKDATTIRIDAYRFLDSPRGAPFDVIYIAPPQYHKMWEKVLGIIDKRPAEFLQNNGIVIVQIDPKEYRELALENLTLYDRRRYGSTFLCFYEPLTNVT